MELAEVVGSLSALQRFPIEPLSGETPNVAPVRGAGLLGDRAHDLCDARTGEALSAAANPQALFYDARYLDDLVVEDLDAWTRIRNPGGEEFPLADPRWRAELAKLLGRDVVLKPRRPAGEMDAPLRLLSRATLRLAERTYGAPLESNRVRANLIVEITGGKAFDEDGWIGRRLRIGDTEFEAMGPANDCFVTAFRPKSGRGDPGMLDGLLNVRAGRFGLSIRVVTGHRVRAGDPVSLSD